MAGRNLTRDPSESPERTNTNLISIKEKKFSIGKTLIDQLKKATLGKSVAQQLETEMVNEQRKGNHHRRQ